MSLARIVSLTIAAPFAWIAAAGAISACGAPSEPKDPALPAPPSASGSDPGQRSATAAPESVPRSVAQQTAELPPAMTAEGPADPPAPPAGTRAAQDLSVNQCKALWDGMQQKVGRFDEAHRACNADADCATVSGRACLGSCSTAISKGSVSDRQALLEKIHESECKTFLEACAMKVPIPVPSCPPYVPVCVGGRCSAQRK
jgi:hypothetical protein